MRRMCHGDVYFPPGTLSRPMTSPNPKFVVSFRTVNFEQPSVYLFYLIMVLYQGSIHFSRRNALSGFHGAFATGVASQQGTLTLPDTWFRPPFWDLLMLQLLRPNSSNLPCLYSTFHLEYSLVLSRFCL